MIASHRIGADAREAILAAKKSGARVLVLKDKGALDARDFFRPWREIVRVHRKQNGKMHIKGVLLDEKVIIFGSLNLFSRSLWKDLEFCLTGRNPAFVSKVNNLAISLLKESSPLGLRDLIATLSAHTASFFSSGSWVGRIRGLRRRSVSYASRLGRSKT